MDRSRSSAPLSIDRIPQQALALDFVGKSTRSKILVIHSPSVESFPLAARSMTFANGLEGINYRYVHADAVVLLYKKLREGAHPQYILEKAYACFNMPGFSTYGYKFFEFIGTMIANLYDNGFFAGIMEYEFFNDMFAGGAELTAALMLWQLTAENRFSNIDDIYEFSRQVQYGCDYISDEPTVDEMEETLG